MILSKLSVIRFENIFPPAFRHVKGTEILFMSFSIPVNASEAASISPSGKFSNGYRISLYSYIFSRSSQMSYIISERVVAHSEARHVLW